MSVSPSVLYGYQSPTLLELLNTAMQQAGQPDSRYGKIRDLKTFAKAVSFLQNNNISTLSELQKTLSEMKKRGLECHKAYKQTKPKKQEDYAERYRTEVANLTVQKDRLYREVRKLKEEVAETVKLCVEQAIPPTEQRKEKSKTQDISL